MRWPLQAAAGRPQPRGLACEVKNRFRGRSHREARGKSGAACLGGTGQVSAPAQPGKASSRRLTGSRRGARRTRIATARFRDDRPSASPTTPKASCRRPGGASPDPSASTTRTFLPISPGINISSTTRCRTRSCGPASGSHTTYREDTTSPSAVATSRIVFHLTVISRTTPSRISPPSAWKRRMGRSMNALVPSRGAKKPFRA